MCLCPVKISNKICLESDPKNAEKLRGNNWKTILKHREGDSNVSVRLQGFKKLQFYIQYRLILLSSRFLEAAQHF